jgi:hypothetical protein
MPMRESKVHLSQKNKDPEPRHRDRAAVSAASARIALYGKRGTARESAWQ